MANESIVVDIHAGTASLQPELSSGAAAFDAAVTKMEGAASELASHVGRIGTNMADTGKITDAITRDMVGAIQKVTLSLQAGERDSRQYFEAIANQRGIDPRLLDPYLAQLDSAKAHLESVARAQREVAESVAFDRQLAAAAKLNQASEYARFWEQALEEAEIAERKLAADDSFIDSLRQRTQAIGKTTADLMEMKAAEMGLTDRAAPFISQLRESESAIRRTGLSAGEMTSALRSVPAQFTDIVVGLQTGQAPLSVLLQQGGQLRDMFGGVGAAAKALGGYMLDLVTPINVAGAATVALAYAAYQGYEDSNKLNAALLLTNNAAGLTSGSFQALGERIATDVNGPVGTAKEVLLQLVSAGDLTGLALQNTAASAQLLADITGGSAADAAKELADAVNGPIEKLVEMNEKLGFLTASEYEHIKALQDAGAAEQAKFEISQQMYDHFKTVSAQNLGTVETMWRTLTAAVSRYWDKVKGIGAAPELAGTLAQLKGQLQSAEYDAAHSGVNEAGAATIKNLKLQIQGVESDLRRAQVDAGKEAERTANQKQGIAALQRLDALEWSIANNAERRAKAIAQYRKDVEEAKAGGVGGEYTAARMAAVEQKIADKFKDPKGRKPSDAAARAAAREEENYGDLLNRLSGISRSYNNDLDRLYGAYSSGRITLEQYRHEVEQLILTQTDIGKEAKKQIDAIAAIDAKIEAEQQAIDVMRQYGAAASELSEGEKEAIKLRKQASVAATDYAQSNLLALAAANDRLGVLQHLSKETAAYVALEKQQADAAAQAAFDSRQWQEDAQQEIRLLGMAESYRAVAAAQYEAEKQTKRELFAIQQQINQALRDEAAAKDATLKAEIARRRGLLESQYQTVEKDGAGKADKAGAQVLAVQAKNAATEAAKAARTMSAAWSASSNSVVQSIGKMMTSLGEYAQQQADFAKEQAALDEQRSKTAGIASVEERVKAETALNALQMDLDKRRTDANLSGTAQMMGLASQMFAEGSRGRKAAHDMEMAFLAIEIGEKTMSAIAGAVEAVTNQGRGDPYTAIPRALAMAAMMAGVLSNIGASFSSGGGSSAAAAVPLDTSGTVLGSTDPSQSISNSLGWLQDLEADQYAELRGINSGMKSLNRNLSGVASAIYRNAGLTGQLPSPGVIGTSAGAAESLVNSVVSSLPGLNFISGLFGNIVGGLTGKIFGGGQTVSIEGSGITSTLAKLGTLLDGGILDVQAWQRIKTETDGGWFGSDSTSISTNFSDIGGEVEHLLTQVFGGLGQTLLSVGEQLNIDASAAIRALDIQLPQIDLGGKSGSDMQKALEEAISAMSDSAVDAVFGSVLRQYQKLNEGLLETATRTVSEMAVVNDALRMTGYGIKATGLDASQSLVSIAGSASDLHDAAESFFKSYYTDAEQAAFNTQRLAEQFAALGMVMPQTKAAFRDLVEGQDITTQSGREAYAALLSLSSAFDDVVSSADKLTSTLTSWLASHQLSDTSTLSTEQKYATAQAQFDDMLQKAAAGDTDAQGKLTDAADTLLGLAREMYASGGQYVGIESYVTSQIQRLAGVPAVSAAVAPVATVAPVVAVVPAAPVVTPASSAGRIYSAADAPATDWSRYGSSDVAPLLDELRGVRSELATLRKEQAEQQQANLQQRGALGHLQLQQTAEQNRLAQRAAAAATLS